MVEYRIRVLHLSDLHLGKGGASEVWRTRRVLGDAWLRNLDDIVADGRAVDLVCFTGDVAFSGQSAQYRAATAFIQETLDRLRVDPQRFFPIPGNHDMDRGVHQAAWRKLRADLSPDDAIGLSRWMAGGHPPRGISASAREKMLARQQAYRDWITSELKRPELAAEASPHGLLGYRITLDLPGVPVPVHLIGLDTAWLCGDDHDAGKLWLTDDQIMRLAGDRQGEPLDGLRLALTHHPLSELMDGAVVRRLLAERVDLMLRGHLHEAEPTMWADPQRQLREAAAGCLYEHDRYPNGCQLIDLTLDDTGRILRYDVWFRSWSSRGHWFSDDGLYADSQGGRLTLWIVPRPDDPAGGRLLPPVGDVFVGRQAELQQIRDALLPAVAAGTSGHVLICAVQGMPGIGKTYLAERFIHEHGDAFPGGVLRLGLSDQIPCRAEAVRDHLLDRLRLAVPEAARWNALQRTLSETRMLLLVENVDDVAWGDVAAELAARLPACPLLVTGRYGQLGAAGGWTRIAVPEFAIAEGVEQLQRELGSQAAELDDAALAGLAARLGGLPLALHLAAGYLRAGYSIDRFLEKLAASRMNLLLPDPSDPARRSMEARAVLHASFEMSAAALRAELKRLLRQESPPADVDQPASQMYAGFLALGHAPAEGVGAGLGAAIAGLDASRWEDLCAAARALSLLQSVPERPRAVRVHPLLAQWLVRQAEDQPHASAASVLDRMTDWFVERLPKRPAGEEDAQGQAWRQVHEEYPALVAWLRAAPAHRLSEIERAGSWFGMLSGPFAAWQQLCELGLLTDDDDQRSNFLWTLAQVALGGGDLDRALRAAREKVAVEGRRDDEREAALAWGVIADIFQARGELDEALRIRREEELPVYERLGDVRSLLVGRAKLALNLIQRNGPGDRDEARSLLEWALAAAQKMQLPEADTIRGILDEMG